MRHSGYKSAFHIYGLFLALMVLVLAAGAGMVVYAVTVRKPDGEIVRSDWAAEFAGAFSEEISFAEGEPVITQKGLEALKDNGLWLQILDSSGHVVKSAFVPEGQPEDYSPDELLGVLESQENGAVFSGISESGGQRWTYLIGFPLDIARITMNVNAGRFVSGKAYVLFGAGAVLLLTAGLGLAYGFAVTRRLSKMTRAVAEIAGHRYTPVREKGAFQDVYASLNTLDEVLQTAEADRQKDERMRKEWIANITHDLKTPLSPIRGYAELLAASDGTPDSAGLQEYSAVILKNTAYAEALINDLKLTYQLENGMVPLDLQSLEIVRFVRELVIDCLNDPRHDGRLLAFEAEGSQLLSFDAGLMKRALNNLLINTLLYSGGDVKAGIKLMTGEPCQISIWDEGPGMSGEQQEHLFDRYYRGAASGTESGGTGLGMAIAREIILLHGGSIEVDSHPGQGTVFRITLPSN
ncbi:HAMP domain-containing sensor histidine kinase [Eubacterium sp. 1001713B170207_170306_E7]|uniref:sensor histidine kinase n=1 Tax=Eubacterium sp. 1001713B170207_170306_E7 TaxID=2787097 RepID=UPI001899A39C|nr:HAMP domain-containing sensor histidine kinase [Eubacterium sp. 1001713B170207_170306_E7]